MRLDDLAPNPGAKRARKRVGRGRGSGSGKTSGRGHKGDNQRSGGGVRPGFEGGQTPLHMRTPKLRGPNKKRSMKISIHRRSPAIVNVGSLARFAPGTEVDLALLVAHNLCRPSGDGLRVLGDGELTVPLTVRAEHFSAAARAKIEAAGGSAVVLGQAVAQE